MTLNAVFILDLALLWEKEAINPLAPELFF